MVIVGGQAIVAWALHFGVQVPETETPYLTQDVDFFGIKEDARWLASKLNGKFVAAELGDATPNAATIVIPSADGKSKLLIDFLLSVLGLEDDEVRRLAAPIQFGDHPPVHVLHPLLCLESRLENLYRLSAKRDGNGIAQAHIAIEIARCYLTDLLDQHQWRQAYKAVSRILRYCSSPAAVFCYAEYQLDPLLAIEPGNYPNPQFAQNWPWRCERIARKRALEDDRRCGVIFEPRGDASRAP